MRRQDVLVFLSGAAITVPVRTAAQSVRVPRVGVLMLGNPDLASFLREVRNGLRELGYVEGETIVLELRDAKGSTEALKSLAHELVASNVDAIVGFQTPSVIAAKEATAIIPIVMCPAADPIRSGLVASLARPGGNITGMSTATTEVAGKCLEFVREALPVVRGVGIIGNALDPFHKPFLEYVNSAGRSLGFEVSVVLAQGADGLVSAFADLKKEHVGAVMVQPSLPRALAAETALGHRLPLFAPTRNSPMREGCYLIPRTSRRSTVNLRFSSTRYSRAESLPNCRSRCRPNSFWSST